MKDEYNMIDETGKDYCLVSAVGKVVTEPSTNHKGNINFELKIKRKKEDTLTLNVILMKDAQKAAPLKNDHIQLINGTLFSKDDVLYCGIKNARDISVIAYDEGDVSAEEALGI